MNIKSKYVLMFVSKCISSIKSRQKIQHDCIVAYRYFIFYSKSIISKSNYQYIGDDHKASFFQKLETSILFEWIEITISISLAAGIKTYLKLCFFWHVLDISHHPISSTTVARKNYTLININKPVILISWDDNLHKSANLF